MPHPEGFDRKDKSNPWIFFRSLLLEILYGGETSKNQEEEGEEPTFPSPYTPPNASYAFPILYPPTQNARGFTRG
jgi:hypothetical protein